MLKEPSGLAFDSSGNLYVADTGNHCIRKIDTEEYIYTIAGDTVGNASGYPGEGGPASEAVCNSPVGLAMDAWGSLFIADRDNHVVRMIDSQGEIRTVAGNGEGDYSGDNGPSMNASLNKPSWLAVDLDGNLLISDQDNHRVRIVIW